MAFCHGERALRGADLPAARSDPGVVIYEGTYPGWPWVAASKAAALLASDDADYIAGTTLLVDGDFWLRGAGACPDAT